MIWPALLGSFFILHALVHLLYAGHVLRFFELRPGQVRPDGTWALSRLLGEETIRSLAAVFLALTALAFFRARWGCSWGRVGGARRVWAR